MHSAGGRFAWYDRNPAPIANDYVALAIAPHGQTTRWTYTVPAGKKFAVQVLQAAVVRQTAAGAAALQSSSTAYTKSGGAAVAVIYAPQITNTVGGAAQFALGSTMVLLAGDVIAGQTLDTSTGGTGVYVNNMQGLEFDA